MSSGAASLNYRHLFELAVRAGSVASAAESVAVVLQAAQELTGARHVALVALSEHGPELIAERAGRDSSTDAAARSTALLALLGGAELSFGHAFRLQGYLLFATRGTAGRAGWLVALGDKPTGRFEPDDEAWLSELSKLAGNVFLRWRPGDGARPDAATRDAERLRYALDGTNDGLWDWDIATQQTYRSPRYLAIFGFEPHQDHSTFVQWAAGVHPDDFAATIAALNAMVSGEAEEYSAEYRYRSKSNAWIWVLDRGKVVARSADGRALRAAGTLTDITHRKRAEQRYRFALDATSDGIWDWDVRTGAVYRNDRYFALRGYQPDEIEGDYDSWRGALHPDERDAVEAAFWEHMNGATEHFEHEYRLRTKPGQWMWVRERAKVVERTPDGHPLRVVGAHMDITGRRRTEEMLRAQRERLKAALSASKAGTYRWDIATDRVSRDENMNRLLGNATPPVPDGEDEMHQYIETTLQQFFARVHPDDLERLRRETSRSLADRKDLQIDYRIILPTGELRWIAENGKLFLDAEGAPRYMTGACTDITERKTAEEELARSRDRAEAANRAKSAFLANMSHELRTPLNAVIGFSDAMLNGYAGDLSSKQAEYVADINASGEHLLAIVNDVLDLSKVEAGKLELFLEPVRLSDAIATCVGLMQPRAESAQVRLEAELPEPSVTVWADELRLRQILLNLLSNAVKFTPASGEVRLGATAQGDMVRMTVSDTGIGMRPPDVALALEPFSQVDGSLARRFEGTGLGLPLVKCLTEMHGGTLDIQTRLGEGTTVTVSMPQRRPQHQGQAA